MFADAGISAVLSEEALDAVHEHAMSILEEIGDLDERTRHMDMDYTVLRLSDKPLICYGTSGPKARDAVDLAAIACGGREAIEAAPAIMGVVNPNSPLVWDFLMVDALVEW